MSRGKVDTSAVVGAAVVFTIIGVVVFSLYFFLILQPAEAALNNEKQTAMVEVGTLNSIGTTPAINKALNYTSQIDSASSPIAVKAILNNVDLDIQIEETRRRYLDLADYAANGAYFSATGYGETTVRPELADLLSTLESAINSKQSIDDLEAYEADFNSEATATWRNILTSVIAGLGDNVGMYIGNPLTGGGYMTNSEAIDNVNAMNWEFLRKLKFETKNTVEVPILDTVGRAPTVRPGSVVNIYAYNLENLAQENVWMRVPVRNVIYSSNDISTIAWDLTDGLTTDTYSTRMWEAIKAAAAGDAEASAVGITGYGSDLMDRAMNANILDYDVSVIYSVEVPEEIGERIALYEFHMTSNRDIYFTTEI